MSGLTIVIQFHLFVDLEGYLMYVQGYPQRMRLQRRHKTPQI